MGVVRTNPFPGSLDSDDQEVVGPNHPSKSSIRQNSSSEGRLWLRTLLEKTVTGSTENQQRIVDRGCCFDRVGPVIDLLISLC